MMNREKLWIFASHYVLQVRSSIQGRRNGPGNVNVSGIRKYGEQKKVVDPKYAYDVCYIGGRANNGFDEKYKIMLKYFGQFRHSKRKVGIFIGKNLSHEQENLILCSSKVCLNIHDNYQKTLVLTDTNERTFKSLGCNGIVVSDREGFIPKHFPDLPVAATPQDMVDLTEYYLTMPAGQLNDTKERYRNIILKEHTYTARAQKALTFENFKEDI